MSNEYARYSRLVGLTSRWDTSEVDFDEYLWAALYEYAAGDVPAPELIAEIDRLWTTSPEGGGSTDIAFLARLTDSRWATCVAWSDYTGFGCQQGVDWRINPTRETAISQGLDKEARAHLGLPLPGEENAS